MRKHEHTQVSTAKSIGAMVGTQDSLVDLVLQGDFENLALQLKAQTLTDSDSNGTGWTALMAAAAIGAESRVLELLALEGGANIDGQNGSVSDDTPQDETIVLPPGRIGVGFVNDFTTAQSKLTPDSNVHDVSGCLDSIKDSLGDILHQWDKTGWTGEDDFRSKVRAGLEARPTLACPCMVAKVGGSRGCSYEQAQELARALEGQKRFFEKYGLQCKATDAGCLVYLPLPDTDPLLFVAALNNSSLTRKLQVGDRILSVSSFECEPALECTSMRKADVVSFLSKTEDKSRSVRVQHMQACTALHFAVLNKQTDAAKLLASLGAKTDIAMKDGKTVDDLIKADEEMKNAITEGKEKSRKGLPSPNWILDWLWILATKAVVVTTINPFQLLLFW